MSHWAEILAQHGGIVWRTVYRLVGNDADAADCFQDVFLSAWEYSRRHEVNNWPGLLKRMATARSPDHLRRILQQGNCGDGVQLAADGADPADAAQAAELLQQLRAAIAALPPLQAKARCLRFLEQLSYEEIAAELDVSVNHVGVLLNRAKTALRRRLTEPSPDALRTKTTGETP